MSSSSNNFSNNVDTILEDASQTFGVDLSSRGNILNGYKIKLAEFIQGEESIKKIKSITEVFMVCLPLIAILMTYLHSIYKFDLTTLISFWITYSVVTLVVTFFKLSLPPDNNAKLAEAKAFKMENIAHRLSTQIALYNSLENISHNNNRDVIDKLSQVFQQNVATAAKNDWERLEKFCDPDFDCENFKDSELKISLEAIHPQFIEKTSYIVQTINEACSELFGAGAFTTKLYLRTSHQVQEQSKQISLDLLTSIAKYPSSHNSPNGKSWIDTKGQNADVWACINREKKVFTKTERPKGSGKGVHNSILYIALPGSIGVLTVSSSNKNTFSTDGEYCTITKDVEKTLMNATNALFLKAFNVLDSE